MKSRVTLDTAKKRLKGYITKYYDDVRPDVLNFSNFRRELYGYVVSLSHDIAPRVRGWQDHNWRQGLRRNLYSYALDEIDRIDRCKRIKRTVFKILTLGLAG